MKKILLTIGLLATSSFSFADDGVFAINDVCAAFGCFPGDVAGYPVTITSSGSYQLTSNIDTVSTTVDVIQINSNNVTLDLNGFSIRGPRVCVGTNTTLVCSDGGMTANGISSVGRFNIAIKNGMVKGYDSGVALTSTGRNLTVSHIIAEENTIGISLNGQGIINDCITNRNISMGMSGLFSTVLIKDTVSIGNKGGPLFVGGGVCSNVYFHNNGSVNNVCARYTNESTCEGIVACP